MEGFEAIDCPLRGSLFIEASAGTGKTFSITSLLLRLVLEERVEMGRCLLVTYTNAATDELRRKTRERLLLALRQLETGPKNDHALDLVLSGLIEHERVDPKAAISLLRQALLHFDELSVLTIHGFCQRILRDHAFEGGQLFDRQVEPDDSSIIREVILDFWRISVPQWEEGFFDHLRRRGRGLPDLMTLAKTALARSEAAVLPAETTPAAGGPYEEAFARAVREARRMLENEREELLALIDRSGLNKHVYHSRRTKEWLRQVNAWLWQARPSPEAMQPLERFTNAALSEKTEAGGHCPSHEFFDLCDRLVEYSSQLETMLECQWVQVKRDFLRYLRHRLPQRKEELNLLAYDDLLHDARRAIEDSTSGLAESVAQHYPFILIDEFQDTDPTQNAIFQRLHASPEHRLLCFIGDPKQAIYAFRGGDIFTYTEARSKADHLATLDENWRSSPGLIRAVNTVYTKVPAPFRTKDIGYHPARPARVRMEDRQRTLRGEDASMAPMQIWQIAGEPPAHQTQQRCIEATCQEIARLIQLGREGDLEVNGRPLQPSDIAIIIRSHFHAPDLQRRLFALGIPSVSYDRQNIFETREAESLEVFLQVLASPRDESLLKGLLLRELMGYTDEGLAAALADEGRWGALLETMASYRAQWKTEGFSVMFQHFLRREHLPQRLLALADGERRLTNLLHLSELTEDAQATMKLGIQATLQWYRDQRESSPSEEKELRLESDDDRVKVLTIHRSKGLEFPIVFLPFAWVGRVRRRARDHVAFHRRDDEGYLRFIDVGSDELEAHRLRADHEEAAEELRVLYVALTRAQHRVYILYAPESPKYKTSSLAYLWHHGENDAEATLAQIHERLAGRRVARLREDLARLVGASEGAITLRTWDTHGQAVLPPVEDSPAREARPFKGEIQRNWGIASYSLLAGHGETLELPDRDTTHPLPFPEIPRAQLSGMAALPRGARTGNMLHAIYENLSFGADPPSIREEVARQLAAHGLSSGQWLDVVTHHTHEFFHSDLGGVRLADLPDDKRLSELAFHFPLGELTISRLEAFFAQHDLPAKPNQFDFYPVEGFLKGFIDLVFEHEGRFYIADYKSNFLGLKEAAYQSDRLPGVMRDANYVLQYHLYVVALHRYLQYRLGSAYDYEARFGGVLYLFVRGITRGESPKCGVFRDRPSAELVAALASFLTEAKETVHG